MANHHKKYNEYIRKYQQDHKMEMRAASRKYYRKNKGKRRAYSAVCRAILNGTLIKPKTCAVCLNTDLQAHHEDYSKPLGVTWLCPRHHGAYHKLQRFMLKEEIDRETLRLFV